MPPETTPPTPRPPETPREILREVTLVFAISIAGCLALIGLGHLVPFVATNLHAFVALLFLLLPAYALRRRDQGLEDYGLHGRGVGRALLVAGAAVLIAFPPYTVGHHFYQTQLVHRPLSFSWSNYSAFPDECQGAPGSRGPLAPSKEAPAQLTVYCERDEVHFRWRGELALDVRGEGVEPRTVIGTSGSASVRVPPGGRLEVSARRGQTPLEPRAIEVGARAARAEAQPLREGRGLLWILELLLAQLIAVALPEEVFYRGYLQGRLEAAFPRRRRFFGAVISPLAVFWTSVLFALGHFLLDLNPQRLAVFFPSLAFGWIRAHTPTLAGAIVFHALCNVLVRLLVVHY